MARHTQKTVLLVDDHPSIRMILGAGLEAQGFRVITAATAEKALAFCEAFEQAIDVLFTDVGLSPLELPATEEGDDSIPHGVALAKRAIKIRPSLKVLLFTGHSDERLRPLQGGIEEFHLLRKPSDLVTITKTLRQLLQERTPNAA